MTEIFNRRGPRDRRTFDACETGRIDETMARLMRSHHRRSETNRLKRKSSAICCSRIRFHWLKRVLGSIDVSGFHSGEHLFIIVIS